MTPREKFVAALEDMLDAVRNGALDERAQSDFMTLDEACLALGIRATKPVCKVKAVMRKAKGKGWARRDGYGLVIERKGLMQHVRTMRTV